MQKDICPKCGGKTVYGEFWVEPIKCQYQFCWDCHEFVEWEDNNTGAEYSSEQLKVIARYSVPQPRRYHDS